MFEGRMSLEVDNDRTLDRVNGMKAKLLGFKSKKIAFRMPDPA